MIDTDIDIDIHTGAGAGTATDKNTVIDIDIDIVAQLKRAETPYPKCHHKQDNLYYLDSNGITEVVDFD